MKTVQSRLRSVLAYMAKGNGSSSFVIIVIAIVSWTYYCVVRYSYLTQFSYDKGGAILNFVVFTALTAMIFVCYFAAALTSPGNIPKSFRPEGYETVDCTDFHDFVIHLDQFTRKLEEERKAATSRVEASSHHEKANQDGSSGDCDVELQPLLPVEQNSTQKIVLPLRPGSRFVPPTEVLPRFCKKCSLFKPDRAHHCSSCDNCVLRMDHHCPWINNCVGYHNHKFFVLFLFYVSLGEWFGIVSSFPHLKECATNLFVCVSFQLFVNAVFSLSMAIAITCLFGFHLFLALTNRTTIESSGANPFHLGSLKANFVDFFGTEPSLWLLPTREGQQGDGLVYNNGKDLARGEASGKPSMSDSEQSKRHAPNRPHRGVVQRGSIFNV